ncbi:MAG: NAD(P)/FAD-dependent oxidoreductase [Myxococcota bacterium]
MVVLVTNLPLSDDPECAVAERLAVARERIRKVELVRKSLDARARPPRWQGNFRVEVEGDVQLRPGVRPWTSRDEAKRGGVPPARRRDWNTRPIVVGAGPAGLFAALRLAEAGAPVVLLERGQPVEGRVPVVNGFWRGQPLDPDNNILFGEGGAGTFSDGKIYTRRRDGELGYVFRVLVECGADPAILDEAWAHLGTDKVRAILPALRARLRDTGAEIRFGAVAEAFLVEGGRCVGVRLRDGEVLRGGPVIVAAGHSARDTMRAMLDAGAVAEQRPIAIGARIEHPQAVVDAARYPSGRGDLPPASYRLAAPGERDAYTFCMCPGGMVVPAMNDPGRVVVNGMSFAARRAFWANSALIVQVRPADYGAADPMAGVRFQDAIEQAAFAATGSYAAPAQRVPDFLAGHPSEDLPRTSYPMGVVPAGLGSLLPRPVVEGMRRAILAFEKEIPGFAGPEGVLIAPETRTTAPLRFLRGADLHSTSLPGLLPVGEGAGWAGGIVSAALDGFKAAEAVIAGP